MDDRERALADAIVLERAGRVLRRREQRLLRDPASHLVLTWLDLAAAELRKEAEDGTLPIPGI